MQNKRLHTPEGVRDIYNDECEKKHYILDRMRQVIQSYGYRFIETPTFEFFDIFGQEVGTTPSKDLYKFFDREGNTLVLRPDMTPSIARAASKYFPIETEPVRLCYEGNVFINNNSYQGRLKESTQLGVEFIGENSVDADGEIIALVVNNLKAAGLEQFQISIGHADLFRQLMKAADFDAEAEETLRDLILNKNFFGVDEFLERHQVTDDLRSLFSMLGKMYASPKEWAGMNEIALRFPGVADALSYLQELYELLEVYDVTKYVSFELGLISSYSYYTGILFSGYTFGSGEPIVKGGRYERAFVLLWKRGSGDRLCPYGRPTFTGIGAAKDRHFGRTGSRDHPIHTAAEKDRCHDCRGTRNARQDCPPASDESGQPQHSGLPPAVSGTKDHCIGGRIRWKNKDI